MLKRENRLRTLRLNSPKTFSTPIFNLKIGKNSQEAKRFAFVVSKKIDKRAVVRNSLKRKFRSCIEEIFDNIGNGWDFIFYPKQAGIKSTREQILEEIKTIFLKSNLLK